MQFAKLLAVTSSVFAVYVSAEVRLFFKYILLTTPTFATSDRSTFSTGAL